MRKLCVVILFLGQLCFAKDQREWLYTVPSDRVFKAAIEAVSVEKWQMGVSDRKRKTLRFRASQIAYLVAVSENSAGESRVSLSTYRESRTVPPAGVTEGFAEKVFTAIQHRLEPTIAPPRQLSRSGVSAFNRYLLANDYKAFAVSPKGHYGYAHSRRFRSEAMENSIRLCQRFAEEGARCELVMVNGLRFVKEER